MTKKKVLFVGSFMSTAKDGSVGGQMFASKTLVNSRLSDFVDWTLLDSTADSNVKSGTLTRVKKAVIRLCKFCGYLVINKYDHVLIFAGDGWSFWEKGLMGIIAKIMSGAQIIIAPRSGIIINDLNNTKFLKKFISNVFNTVDTIICQSQIWKDLFSSVAEKSDKSKFIVIENIIDLNKYKSIIQDKRPDDEKVTLLFMAWVTRDKGIFELLEAVKILRRGNLNFKLKIAGKGESFEEIESKIRDESLNDCCELLGWVLGDKKDKLLMSSDIFVLPTYFEGYPNSLLEAMASGIACISTNVGSIPDIIEDFETGFVVEKKNAEQLADKLELLIREPKLRQKFAYNAMEKVKSNNSIEVGINKYETVFDL